MDLKTVITYQFIFDPKELRLLQRALRGVIQDPKEVEEAKALQARIARLKHTMLLQATTEAAKAVENIDESLGQH